MENNNSKKRNRILFDFDSIVDLKLSYIHSVSDIFLNELKMRRMYVYEDPMKLVPIVDDIDLDHPSNPIFTSMKTLLETFLDDPNCLVRPTVLCKDESQQLIIKKAFSNVKVLVAPRERVKTLNFTRIVVGNPYDCLEFTDPVTVDFMILNFREYFDESDPTLLPREVLLQLGDVNRFTIAKAYPEIEEPKG